MLPDDAGIGQVRDGEPEHGPSDSHRIEFVTLDLASAVASGHPRRLDDCVPGGHQSLGQDYPE